MNLIIFLQAMVSVMLPGYVLCQAMPVAAALVFGAYRLVVVWKGGDRGGGETKSNS